MSIRELDKAKRILDRQIKAGVITIPYNAADKDGLDMAYGLAKQMGEQGHIVISGLALECDTVTHQGCLDAGGQTIAVVVSGLDITHPKVNKSLQDEIIAKGGVILSEHPFGWENNVYSVQYDTQNELNSGNKFLLDYNLALPIRLGQEITLDLDNKIVIA